MDDQALVAGECDQIIAWQDLEWVAVNIQLIKRVLRFFDAQGVDAVMVTGDIAHTGLIKEFERQLGVGVNTTTPDGLFSIEAVRCLGCCGLAPAMMVNDEVYGRLVPGDVKGIIEKYRARG